MSTTWNFTDMNGTIRCVQRWNRRLRRRHISHRGGLSLQDSHQDRRRHSYRRTGDARGGVPVRLRRPRRHPFLPSAYPFSPFGFWFVVFGFPRSFRPTMIIRPGSGTRRRTDVLNGRHPRDCSFCFRPARVGRSRTNGSVSRVLYSNCVRKSAQVLRTSRPSHRSM